MKYKDNGGLRAFNVQHKGGKRALVVAHDMDSAIECAKKKYGDTVQSCSMMEDWGPSVGDSKPMTVLVAGDSDED